MREGGVKEGRKENLSFLTPNTFGSHFSYPQLSILNAQLHALLNSLCKHNRNIKIQVDIFYVENTNICSFLLQNCVFCCCCSFLRNCVCVEETKET